MSALPAAKLTSETPLFDLRKSCRQALIIFSRFPEPGQTKTRLIPALGPEQAARLQCCMLQRVLQQAALVLPREQVIVAFHGGSKEQMRSLYGKEWSYLRQKGFDLGRRMLQAIAKTLNKGLEQVLLCGSDCPGLSAEIIAQGFEYGKDKDLVLGPARDGGYYLIGIRRGIPAKHLTSLFDGIDWGTERVLAQTRHKAEQAGLSVGMTPILQDVDRPEDLSSLPDVCREDNEPLISLVLPTLNEEDQLGQTLHSIKSAENIQIIVADGGSQDKTVDLARDYGVQVVHSPPGRARQMNRGAGLAEGRILIFVHADTRLPFGYDVALRRAVEREGALGGAFAFALDKTFPGSTLVTRMVHWRSRYLRSPYGDQALFVRADVFHELGGYPELPILEDVYLVRRLKSRGRFSLIDLPALTSGRRWSKLGVLKTTLVNQLIMAGDVLGVSPRTLAKLYRRK